ncbi:PR domain zinc finger protein 8 [Bombina bombina]|uniref:PR domain zinc finger protein 8 n=1 Tax=Bombina bombina TaxID=8345 RepID=UPI00235AA1D1|nr:PR domain zinc finger protein 8 [Bombina bombina]
MSIIEDNGVQKTIWDGDAKAVQQCLTDIFTSVYTTCDIPENAIFGPCVLSHTSLYDSIAFIALKSTDKRTVPYIFRVDTSAANGSSEGLMWLRLVQSARNKEEQNLEAYIKNGQLFYRSLRRIAKDEELLVWYGKELIDLLLLNPSRSPGKNIGSSQSACLDCNQRFQFEFPYVAHVRFRCPKRLHNSDSISEQTCKENRELEPRNIVVAPSKYNKLTIYQPQKENHKPTTDFHNLARDMENVRGTTSHRSVLLLLQKIAYPRHDVDSTSENVPKAKRKYDELDEIRSRRIDTSGRFLDRPMHSSKEDLVCSPQPFRASSFYSLEESGQLYAPPSPETGDAKRSAFVEVKKASRGVEDSELNSEKLQMSSIPCSSPVEEKRISARAEAKADDNSPRGSAFTSVSQITNQDQERKSAFSQPTRSSFNHVSPLQVMGQKLVSSGVNLDCHGDTVGPARLFQSDPLSVKLQNPDLNGNCTLQNSLPKQSPFLFATTFWPKSTPAPLQLQLPSTLTLLPPSFTSLCLPAQNWCAKCNASFRMTSDLVYHMRSHHKKEFAMEPLVKRRREEKLKCPICNESFRERHHLSRHMTSHN